MEIPLLFTRIKLTLAMILSSLWFMLPSVGGAHEVTPTIGDLIIEEGVLTLELRMNLEAFLAGIDLDEVQDTNNASEAERFETLRRLPPEELESEAQTWIEAWRASVTVLADGDEPVILSPEGFDIPEVADPQYARNSILTVTGNLPEGTQTIIVGWPVGSGDLGLRQQGVEDPYTGFIEGGGYSEAIAVAGGFAGGPVEAFTAYVPVGFDHILPKGLDHILFVLGLFFLSTRLGPLLWQISAFTLAHTVTLALGALGVVSVPGSIVEPLIAASITYVAVENVLTSKLHRWRPVIVFGFGLLHGLGFASVLAEFGLPQAQFVPALLGFNVGVEIGQLTVIAIAFLLVGFWFRDKPWYRSRIAVPASCVIAVIGTYWFVERVFL